MKKMQEKVKTVNFSISLSKKSNIKAIGEVGNIAYVKKTSYLCNKNLIIMGLLDNYSGIGMSPRPKWQHQRVMSHMHANMYFELIPKGLEVLTESTVTTDWDDLAPDLVIYDNEYRPLSIIEITTHREYRQIIRKCYELIERFPYVEYFVYDYEKQIMYMYDYTKDCWLSSEEYILTSRYLERPMLDYLA